MQIIDTDISDLKLIKIRKNTDSRGAFLRLFCENTLIKILKNRKIVQINLSENESIGTIRGLHYQKKPFTEIKFILCLKGKVWDVVVDIRKNSLTYLQWHGEELSQNNNIMLAVPEGFAHGFQVLEPNSQIIYFHTEFYNTEVESGLKYDDPILGINWPYPVTKISDRDLSHGYINSNFDGLGL
jgi:dTDP-4-dehydrorhamnose 3,5-epimerase